jgi:hypothetical protein
VFPAWSRTGGTRVWSWRTCNEVRCSRQVWWFGPQNYPVLRMASFAEFGPQNSAAMVPEGIDGGTWHERGGCVKVKQVRVKDVAVG